MPIIDLKISGSEDPEMARALAGAITSCTRECLNKKSEVTAITVLFISDSLWFINSQPLKESGQRSFYLGIKITEKTVTKKQKENYLRAMDKLVRSVLMDLHPASYVYVAEVCADAYGYSGQTMENRFQAASTA